MVGGKERESDLDAFADPFHEVETRFYETAEGEQAAAWLRA